MRIFVTDDDQMVLKAVSLFLKRGGHQVEEYDSAADVLNKLKANHLPDLVLSDMYMPGMNGLELLAAIREVYKELPVIIMTSSREMEVTVKAINNGAFGFLLKPVVFEELAWMLSKVAMEKELRDKLAQETEHLIHAQRLAEVGTVASGIAHEINNPNTFIRGNVSLLQKLWEKTAALLEESNAADPELLRKIKTDVPLILKGVRDGSDRITQIVKSLSFYSRHGKDHQEKADLRKGLEEAQQILANKLWQTELKIVDDIPQVKEVSIPEVHYVQVLVNLLSNAADACKAKEKPTIEIKLGMEGNNMAVVTVIDNGTGISQEHMQKLLTPFFSTKIQGEGTGLGLYITHQLVARNGGTLRYLNHPGGGAEFSISLPLAKKETAA
ncbi:MAG: response regulator [Deltaproteobacteria bacterium]|nr:response regulator [Deltaproteobacteria bacterium]